MSVVEVHNITKRFPMRRGIKAMLGRGGLADMILGKRRETFEALKDVSFTVEHGESLGIIGANGSGKSTLLKILAGVTIPSSGHVEVRGRVASLLELGAGFHPMLTGRENVYLNAGILGMRHAQVDEAFDQMLEFSGIQDFIDNPVETYSSGMYVRIAFAIAAFCNPDIFLIDEVLSVGDEEFQRKCRSKIGELIEQGKTIVFVSHDLGIVNALCDRVILLSHGEMVSRGSPQATIDYYLRQVGQQSGIHTFRLDKTEAIFSHGRLSLFHDKHEITAGYSFHINMLYMEFWHSSRTATWTVTEHDKSSCKVTGQMSRLPIKHHWDLSIRDNKLTWNICIECERDFPLEVFEVNLYLPVGYTQWIYEDLRGEFPEIRPSDNSWVLILSPEYTARNAAAIPSKQHIELVPVSLALNTEKTYFTLRWQNTDYVNGCRVLQAWGQIPASEVPMPKGCHQMMTLELDLAKTANEIQLKRKNVEENRTLKIGNLLARYDNGRIHLYHNDVELTALVFLHSSICIDSLWCDSHHLDCNNPQKKDGGLEWKAASAHKPFIQHWRLAQSSRQLGISVYLEATEDFWAEAYRLSIGLKPDYERWITKSTSDEFPGYGAHAICSDSSINSITALSSTLPSVTLLKDTNLNSCSMAAVNTGAKIIQALCEPDTGHIHFNKGRHILFSGIIEIEPDNKL